MGRPVQWLVEVSAQRDVSRDTLLMAVREAQAASANDALAAANDLLATDGPQGLAYEHAPSLLILVFVADVTPSECRKKKGARCELPCCSRQKWLGPTSCVPHRVLQPPQPGQPPASFCGVHSSSVV